MTKPASDGVDLRRLRIGLAARESCGSNEPYKEDASASETTMSASRNSPDPHSTPLIAPLRCAIDTAGVER